ncbi:MAG: efflux RND transporter permease subunit [Myxococcota bacterium]
MNFSVWAHRNWAVTTLATGLLMVSGLVSYFTLPAKEDPSILVRDAVITTRFPGMSAERVERLITKRLEAEIRRIPELKEIRSTSTPGVSTIHAVVKEVHFDLDPIWDNLRKKVEAVQPELPQGTLPSQVNDDFGDVAIMTFALRSDGFTMSEMSDTAKYLRDTIYGLAGTKRVEVMGAQAERIFVEFETAKLRGAGLSPAQLGHGLAAHNILSPGGEIDAAGRTFVVHPSGAFRSLAEVENTLITIPQFAERSPPGSSHRIQ